MIKDYISSKCICGRVFTIPFYTMQLKTPQAPTFQMIRNANEQIVAEIIYHQNKNKCHIKL